MFFCEFLSYDNWGDKLILWTLENGHCVSKGVIQKNLTDVDESENCVFYLKCQLTNGTATGCDDVIYHFQSLCQNTTINYPSGPLFKPYAQTVYQLSQVGWMSPPNYVLFNGSMKCIGYQARFTPNITRLEWSHFRDDYKYDSLCCSHSEKMDIYGPQIDKNCWNDTKQSFLCRESLQCISKHRLRDGIWDCSLSEDEDDSQTCYMKNKHRFKCSESGKSSVCLSLSVIGDEQFDCDKGIDEYITELKWYLAGYKCTTPNSIECNVLRTYIQSPSSLNETVNNKVLLFREYCDTVWHLPRGFDESLCKQWKCPKDEYQCSSGHCTPLIHVISPFFIKWDCPDASDNIGLLEIAQLSEHNAKLISDSLLQYIKLLLSYPTDYVYSVAFSGLCNTSKEYGCILANVNDPLNFTINRPCINVKQIGDGIIDCYGGLDERNLLTCGNNVHEQRGFDFHCSDQECIPYDRHCEQRCSNNADSLLCDQLQTLWDSACQYPKREELCALSFVMELSCDSLQTRRYYCDITRSGK
jgi:hypothetical protein